MIKVYTFGITADSHGYTVGKVSTYTDKKTGKESEILTAQKYYGDMQGCLRYIRKQLHLDVVKAFDGELADAIKMLNEVDERFEAMIAGVESK